MSYQAGKTCAKCNQLLPQFRKQPVVKLPSGLIEDLLRTVTETKKRITTLENRLVEIKLQEAAEGKVVP